MIAGTFNKYVLSVAQNNNEENKYNNVNISHFSATTHIQYLSQNFTIPFPNITIKSLSTKEVVNVLNLSNQKFSWI
jgi:hypothetical protein